LFFPQFLTFCFRFSVSLVSVKLPGSVIVNCVAAVWFRTISQSPPFCLPGSCDPFCQPFPHDGFSCPPPSLPSSCIFNPPRSLMTAQCFPPSPRPPACLARPASCDDCPPPSAPYRRAGGYVFLCGLFYRREAVRFVTTAFSRVYVQCPLRGTRIAPYSGHVQLPDFAVENSPPPLLARRKPWY